MYAAISVRTLLATVVTMALAMAAKSRERMKLVREMRKVAGLAGVAAVRASVRGRVAYHDCAEKHTALIAKEKAHRKAQGLGEDVRDLEEKVTMASVSTMCAYP